MPKLDVDGRLLIPSDLRRKACIKNRHRTIALCYYFESKLICITNKINTQGNCLVAVRKLDSKGRFYFPKECLELLNASKEDSFILFIKDGKLFVKKKMV